MTPQDMNVKIAEILGFKIKEDNGVLYYAGYDHNMDYCWCIFLNNYTTDKALCWDLVEMLGEAGWDYSKDNEIHCWGKNMGDHYFTVENESLLLGTCEAFIEEYYK